MRRFSQYAVSSICGLPWVQIMPSYSPDEAMRWTSFVILATAGRAGAVARGFSRAPITMGTASRRGNEGVCG
jgi:hypothetical protein